MRRFPHQILAALVVLAAVVEGWQGLLYAAATATAVELALMRLGMADLRWPHWRRNRRDPAPDALSRSFTQLRDEVAWSGHSMREFDRTLRPRLTQVLAVRLAERHGVRLHQDPQARTLVEPQTWGLLDPGRPRVFERGVSGVDPAELGAVVDQLETL